MLNIKIGVFKPTALYTPNIELTIINKYLEIYFHLIIFDIYFCFYIEKDESSCL